VCRDGSQFADRRLPLRQMPTPDVFKSTCCVSHVAGGDICSGSHSVRSVRATDTGHTVRCLDDIKRVARRRTCELSRQAWSSQETSRWFAIARHHSVGQCRRRKSSVLVSMTLRSHEVRRLETCKMPFIASGYLTDASRDGRRSDASDRQDVCHADRFTGDRQPRGDRVADGAGPTSESASERIPATIPVSATRSGSCVRAASYVKEAGTQSMTRAARFRRSSGWMHV